MFGWRGLVWKSLTSAAATLEARPWCREPLTSQHPTRPYTSETRTRDHRASGSTPARCIPCLRDESWTEIVESSLQGVRPVASTNTVRQAVKSPGRLGYKKKLFKSRSGNLSLLQALGHLKAKPTCNAFMLSFVSPITSTIIISIMVRTIIIIINDIIILSSSLTRPKKCKL